MFQDALRQHHAPSAAVAAPVPGHGWRGILIALIVLGHNRMFASTCPGAYRLIYDFHVGCFLVIPFLRPARAGGATALLYPLRSYWCPFCVVVTLYAVMFTLTGSPGAADSYTDATRRWAIAIVVANSAVLNRATGFEMFWFLPVFVILSMLRVAIGGLRARGFAVLCAIAVALHLSVGLLPEVVVAILPWGLPIVGYILLPCLIAAALARQGIADRIPASAAGIAFAAALMLCWALGCAINLSDFDVYSARNLPRLLASDLCVIAASLFFAKLHEVLQWRPFEALGRYSLQIYLVHGMIEYALVHVAGKHHSPATTAALIVATYAITLALAYLASRAMMASRIGRWVFGVTPAAAPPRRAPEREADPVARRASA